MLTTNQKHEEITNYLTYQNKSNLIKLLGSEIQVLKSVGSMNFTKKNSIWASLATMERTGTGAGGGYQLLDRVVDLAKGILPTQIALCDVFLKPTR